MALQKTITLEWGDKSYTIKPDFDLIDRIEDKINLMEFTIQVAENDVRYSHAAKFISILLNEAGCYVTANEIWTQMFSNGDISRDMVNEMIGQILFGLYPDSDDKPVKKNSQSKIEA